MLTVLRILLKTPLLFKTDLPAPLRVGDTVLFNTTLSRVKDGRSATLALSGAVEVASPPVYVAGALPRQLVTVRWVGREPVWVGVKKPVPKVLPPCKFPKFRVT